MPTTSTTSATPPAPDPASEPDPPPGRPPVTSLVVSLLLALVLASCVGVGEDAGDRTTTPGPDPTRSSDPDVSSDPATATTGGWIDGPPPTGTGGDPERGGAAAELGATAPVAPDGDTAEEDLVDDPGGTGPGALRGGSVDDNVDFVDYLDYRDRVLASGLVVHDLDVSERHVVRVVDADGLPVLGATVVLRDGDRVVATRTTYADGIARLHPRAVDPDHADVTEYTVDVALDERQAGVTIGREGGEHELVLADAPPVTAPVPLDVHVVLDATGSMGDEIARLRDTIASVAERIAAIEPAPSLRLGMTVYRDRGDAYVTRTFDFTDDVASFRAALDEVTADGGGDTPEDVNAALHEALETPSWRTGRGVRLVFLVADAGPHLDYPDGPDYTEDVLVAAERGTRIVPLASSGLSDVGEYVFRQLAQLTGAPFLFQTYGADGAPGDDTPHDVGGYDVLALDDLVVRVVEDELARLAGVPVTPPQQ